MHSLPARWALLVLVVASAPVSRAATVTLSVQIDAAGDALVDAVRERIGFMPDHFSMYRQMTVFEYLDFIAAAYGLKMADRDQVINDVLTLTDMDGRRNDLIS